jgi:branched-chain amino acid transport system permease protein
MRAVFRTSYDQDMALFRHRGQALRYAALLAAAAALPLLAGPYLVGEATGMLIWAIAGMGLMIMVGQTGQVSLGHAAFLAIGAYAALILQTRAGLPFPLAFPLAGVIAGAAGALLALPTTRLHGIYLAIATLAFAVLIEDLIIMAEPLTGGVSGMVAPDVTLLGHAINRYAQPAQFYWLTLAVAVAVVLLYRNLLRAPLGRAFAAVRDSEVSARAMGVDVARTKAAAFGLSCAVTGLAGALLAHFAVVITHEHFLLLVSIQLLLMIVIGGLGSIHGAFLGAAVVSFLPQGVSMLRDAAGGLLGWGGAPVPGLETAFFALILVGILLREPMGLYGIWLKIRAYLSLFPFYRRGMFRRQRSYLRTERTR